MVREKDRDGEKAKEINRLIDSCVKTNKQIENRQIYNSANRTNKARNKEIAAMERVEEERRRAKWRHVCPQRSGTERSPGASHVMMMDARAVGSGSRPKTPTSLRHKLFFSLFLNDRRYFDKFQLNT